MFYKTIAVLGLVVYSLSSVQCQATLADEVRANMTRMAKFVIHPSAQASNEIVDYALRMGGVPKTLSERLGYLGFIKDIARGIPEFMSQFSTVKTLPDGLTVSQIDETRFDDAITNKASEYSNRNKSNDTNATQTVGASATGTQTGTGTGTSPGIASGTGVPTGSGSVVPGSQLAPVAALSPASDGTISLLDLYSALNQMQNNSSV